MITALAMSLALSGLPDVSNLNNIKREPTITYLDRSGVMIGMRGGRYGPPVNLDHLPAYVPAAFVSIEDRRFYEHMGFDPVGIARAVAADITKGRTAEGASTITQQLARNLFLTPDQTMERKAQEIALAVMIEQKYSKKQILALYLSRVYFGNGAYGLEAASQRYFGKPAAKLSIAEAAALAGVLKSPTHYNPLDEPQRSAERAKIVLAAMVDTGAITEAQRRKAEARPIRVYAKAASASAQYFVDWVDAQTRSFLGGPPKQDMVVQTTLDLPLEEIAARTTASVVARDARQGVQQAALVSLDSEGRVRAMVGGVDYGESQFNRAVAAYRQAGSSWKPFVYLTAMEAGQTPDMQVVDEPVTINGWSPHNYEPEYLGPITLQDALAHSVNTVAARLADQVGRNNVAQTARRLGISSPINTDPAMALGTTQVTPLEMAQAYSTFADGGLGSSAYGVESIKAGGKVIFQHRAQAHPQLIANPALSEMNQMLRAVVTSGTGVHDAIPGYDIAGKTGTTSDYKDAWFCGFTGGFTTVVWVGRDDSTPMIRVAGAGAPSEIWRGFMSAALPRVHPTAIPPGPLPPPPALPLTAPQDVAAASPPVVEADPETPSAPRQR